MLIVLASVLGFSRLGCASPHFLCQAIATGGHLFGDVVVLKLIIVLGVSRLALPGHVHLCTLRHVRIAYSLVQARAH